MGEGPSSYCFRAWSLDVCFYGDVALKLTLQVSGQQVEPGEQHDGHQRRRQQLQASAEQQVHGGTATLRLGGAQVGFSPSTDPRSISSSAEITNPPNQIAPRT